MGTRQGFSNKKVAEDVCQVLHASTNGNERGMQVEKRVALQFPIIE